VKIVTQLPNVSTTNNIGVLFGDFKTVYTFRQVNPGLAILRLNERYAPAFQIGFVGFARIGGLTKIVGAQNPVLSITIKA
jgi:HK97 family phage major capsid protein